jgi:hypothetical protein
MDEQSVPAWPSSPAPPPEPKQFIGLLMKCCRTYIRAYLNANGDAFIGRCPRCGAMVRINVVEEGGSPSRIFEAW